MHHLGSETATIFSKNIGPKKHQKSVQKSVIFDTFFDPQKGTKKWSKKGTQKWSKRVPKTIKIGPPPIIENLTSFDRNSHLKSKKSRRPQKMSFFYAHDENILSWVEKKNRFFLKKKFRKHVQKVGSEKKKRPRKKKSTTLNLYIRI